MIQSIFYKLQEFLLIMFFFTIAIKKSNKTKNRIFQIVLLILILQVTLQAAWIKVNNTDGNINYSDSWSLINKSGAYNGDVHWSGIDGQGNTAEFSFTGTGIRVYLHGYDENQTIEIYIDDQYLEDATAEAGSGAQYLAFERNSLDETSHTIRIKVKNGEAHLDYFEYLDQSDSNNTILNNSSFELGTTEWNNLTIGNSEYYAPPDGDNYGMKTPESDYTYQETDQTIEAGKTYKLTVWTRRLPYTESELKTLKDDPPQKNTALAKTEIQFYYGSTEIISKIKNVNPVEIKGAPQDYPNDDGGNVWIDKGYRHEFAGEHFYQPLEDDPISDPWSICEDTGGELDAWAVGPVIVPGHKWIYGVYYDDTPPDVYSEIKFIEAVSGGDPEYHWEDSPTTVLTHDGDEDPWVIDPHLFYDDETERLWMTWGGGTIWVSEMDPEDGELINHPQNLEFDTHSDDAHTEVAYWDGDEWSSEWFEGGALYKHNGYWYLFASYGNLALNYTIRMGRGTNPTGPFYDKDGIAMTEWNSARQEYGNSFLLGDDAGQLSPGHTHIWEENGNFYMGFDYIPGKGADYEKDIFGIRQIYWINDWPTIWQPVTLTFKADDYPDAIGKKLGIAFRNAGETGSIIGVDSVNLDIIQSTNLDKSLNYPKGFKLYQNYPNPFNPDTEIKFKIPRSCHVTLDVYNLLGERVKRLLDNIKPAGVHKINFDGTTLTSGIYYYRIKADNFVETKKCLFLK